MKSGFWGVTAGSAVILLAALSTGSPVLLAVFFLLFCMALYALISAVWAARTLRLTGNLDERTVHRGEEVRLTLQVRHLRRHPRRRKGLRQDRRHKQPH